MWLLSMIMHRKLHQIYDPSSYCTCLLEPRIYWQINFTVCIIYDTWHNSRVTKLQTANENVLAFSKRTKLHKQIPSDFCLWHGREQQAELYLRSVIAQNFTIKFLVIVVCDAEENGTIITLSRFNLYLRSGLWQSLKNKFLVIVVFDTEESTAVTYIVAIQIVPCFLRTKFHIEIPYDCCLWYYSEITTLNYMIPVKILTMVEVL